MPYFFNETKFAVIDFRIAMIRVGIYCMSNTQDSSSMLTAAFDVVNRQLFLPFMSHCITEKQYLVCIFYSFKYF